MERSSALAMSHRKAIGHTVYLLLGLALFNSLELSVWSDLSCVMPSVYAAACPGQKKVYRALKPCEITAL